MKKRVVGSLLGLIAFAAIGSASTVACNPDGAVVIGTGAVASISCGPLVFDSFSATVINPVGGTANLTMAPYAFSYFDNVSGIVNLIFNPSFVVPPGSIEDVYFFFKVTGPVTQVDLSASGSVGTGINEAYCSAAFVNNACPAGSQVSGSISVGSNESNPGTPFGTTVSTLYIFKDIQLNNTLGTNTGELSSFSQSFHTAVPEPMTFSLMGAGLLGLGLLRKRAGRKG
jgi:hypothetical protein